MLKIIFLAFLLTTLIACNLTTPKSTSLTDEDTEVVDPALLNGEIDTINAKKIKNIFLKASDVKTIYDLLTPSKKVAVAEKLAASIETEEEYDQLKPYFFIKQSHIGSNPYETLRKSTNPKLRTILTKKITQQAEKILEDEALSDDLNTNLTGLAALYDDLYGTLQESDKKVVIIKLQSYIGKLLDHELKDKELALLTNLTGILQLIKNIEASEGISISSPPLNDYLKKFLQRFATDEAIFTNNQAIRKENNEKGLRLDLIHNLNGINKNSTADSLLLVTNELIDDDNYKNLTIEEIKSLIFILNNNPKSAFKTPSKQYLAILDLVLSKSDDEISEKTKTSLIFNMISNEIDETQAHYLRQADKMLWVEKAILNTLSECTSRKSLGDTMTLLKINVITKEQFAALKENDVKDEHTRKTALAIDFLRDNFASTNKTLLDNLSSLKGFNTSKSGMLDAIKNYIFPHEPKFE